MLTKDSDILAVDPIIFRDGLWATRLVTKGVGTVDGVILNASSVDVEFEAAQLEEGDVVVIANTALHVLSLIAMNVMEVSGPLTRSGNSRPVPTIPSQAFSVVTFLPTTRVVEEQLLGQFGIEPGTGAVLGLPIEGHILNPRDVARVVAWGVVQITYAILAGADGKDSRYWKRSEHAREMFDQAKRSLTVYLDTDGDGKADMTRRLTVTDVARS